MELPFSAERPERGGEADIVDTLSRPPGLVTWLRHEGAETVKGMMLNTPPQPHPIGKQTRPASEGRRVSSRSED